MEHGAHVGTAAPPEVSSNQMASCKATHVKECRIQVQAQNGLEGNRITRLQAWEGFRATKIQDWKDYEPYASQPCRS